jgi:hypothetical protein
LNVAHLFTINLKGDWSKIYSSYVWFILAQSFQREMYEHDILRKGHSILTMSICTSHILFPLNNLSSPKANLLKFIHKVRDPERKTKFDLGLYHFSDLELWPCINLQPHFFLVKIWILLGPFLDFETIVHKNKYWRCILEHICFQHDWETNCIEINRETSVLLLFFISLLL